VRNFEADEMWSNDIVRRAANLKNSEGMLFQKVQLDI